MTHRRYELLLQDALADVREIREELEIQGVGLEGDMLGEVVVNMMMAKLTNFASYDVKVRMLSAIGGPSSIAEAALILGWDHRERLQ